jgi:hypothetical protein
MNLIQQALKILEPIPEELFITEEYSQDDKTHCCSLGHINKAISGNPTDSEIEIPLREEIASFIRKKYMPSGYVDIVQVNDGYDGIYKEDGPKARVMHLLKDMLNEGYK